jgi:hypothetical protein
MIPIMYHKYHEAKTTDILGQREYVSIYNKNNISEKSKTSYNLKWNEYISNNNEVEHLLSLIVLFSFTLL